MSKENLTDFLTAVRDDLLDRAAALLRESPDLASVHVPGSCWELDPNSSSTETCAPIHYCAVHGRAKMARLLLESGADPNVLGFEGNNSPENGYAVPISLAAWEGGLETMRVLLEHGADADGQNGAAMHTALGHLNNDRCELLLKHGATLDLPTAAGLGMIDELKSLLDGQTPYDDRAFEMAVCQNQVAAMKLLVEAGHMGDIDRKGNMVDFTPLQLGAYYGAAEAVAYLIELGADVNKVKSASKWQWDESGTALHVACSEKKSFGGDKLRIVQMLVKAGADTSIRNADGKTAAELRHD